jgi:hypothetical protein
MSSKKNPTAPVSIPNRRPLDEIAADIDALDRKNVFDKGELFLEAKDTHPGEFLYWLEERDYSADTAERCMGVAKLGTRFRNLRNLKLGKTTLYALTDEDEEKMAAIIEALAKVATKQHLKPADAEKVIQVAKLRIQFGNYPDATLLALDDVPSRAEWHDKAAKALKAKQPTTEEEAEQIVDVIQRSQVEALYHGELPDGIPSDSLNNLESVPAECRGKVLQRLLSATVPLTRDFVYDACYAARDEDAGCAHEPKPAQDDEEQEEHQEVDATFRPIEPKIQDRRKNSAPAPTPDDPFASGLSMVTSGVEAMLIAKPDDVHAVFQRVRQHIAALEQVRSPSVVPGSKPSEENDGLDIPDYLRREPKNEATVNGAGGTL